MLFYAGGHNQWRNFYTAWVLYAWKGSEKEVSQCNVFLMERHVTTFRRLQLQVTINNLVWQQINSRRYSTFAIELFGPRASCFNRVVLYTPVKRLNMYRLDIAL